jgi:hypothetical protein
MTGGEIVPVVQAAGQTAKKAIDDSADRGALQGLAADSPNMKSAAESYARRVAVKQGLLLKLYQPLARYFGLSRDYFDTQFHDDMAHKVADIPEEHLATPSPSVAIPAMQGLSYAIEEPDLKEMYLNLLATATDERVKDNAHPSFAEIIKQLSPREATLLLEVLRQSVLPVVRLMLKAAVEDQGESTALSHLIEIENVETREPSEEPLLPVWIDNWIRLGLIDVDYMRKLTAENRYDWVEGRPEYIRLVGVDPRGKEGIRVAHGLLRVTDFGNRFVAAVSYDGISITGAPGVQQQPDEPKQP